MSLFSFLKRKPAAAVFVDFEHWCYALNNLFKLRPQIQEFYNRLNKQYNIKRLMFFGDFTQPLLRTHIDDIRRFTNNIIDTQNGSEKVKKDFSDFIMLDYIYQDVDQFPKTDAYIIFSGDGHFSSVASYLKTRKKKKLIVCGIKDATSNKLKVLADECIQYPTEEQENSVYYKMIIDNFDFLASLPEIKYPTFVPTVKAVSIHNHVDESKISLALEDLIRQGVINRKKLKVNFKEMMVLQLDWDVARERGLWQPAE